MGGEGHLGSGEPTAGQVKLARDVAFAFAGTHSRHAFSDAPPGLEPDELGGPGRVPRMERRLEGAPSSACVSGIESAVDTPQALA